MSEECVEFIKSQLGLFKNKNDDDYYYYDYIIRTANDLWNEKITINDLNNFKKDLFTGILVAKQKSYKQDKLPDINKSLYLEKYIENRTLKDGKSFAAHKDKNLKEVRKIAQEININDKIKNFYISGLVIGDVQSGKTENFMMLMAHAFDLGYERVIILSGMLEDLRNQTSIRVDDSFELVSYNGFSIKIEDISNLNDSKKDFSSNSFPYYMSIEKQGKNYLITKKNKTILENLIRYYEDIFQFSEKMDNKNYNLFNKKTLIIDDEADLASINTSKKESDENSTINMLILKLINLFPKVSYVAYTATFSANVFQERNIEGERKYLFPKDFVKVIDHGVGYFGYKQIYEEYSTTNQIIKKISKQECGEFDDLKRNLKLNPNTTYLDKKFNYVDDFIIRFVNNYINSCNKIPKIYTAIINPDVVNRVHTFIEKYVKEKISFWIKNKNIILDICNNNDDYKQNSELIFENLSNIRCFIKDLSESTKTTKNKTFIDDLSDEIKVDHKDKLALFIGGHKLSRGITFPNLLNSMFLRTTKTADTITQMSRWFGYKGDLKFNIYFPESFVDLYFDLLDANSEFKTYIKNIDSVDDIDANTFYSMTLNKSVLPTSVNKLRHVTKNIVINRGRKDCRFSVNSPDTYIENKKFIFNFLMENQENIKFDDKKIYIENLSKDYIIDILNNLKFPDEKINQLSLSIKHSLKKWSVILPIRKTSLSLHDSSKYNDITLFDIEDSNGKGDVLEVLKKVRLWSRKFKNITDNHLELSVVFTKEWEKLLINNQNALFISSIIPTVSEDNKETANFDKVNLYVSIYKNEDSDSFKSDKDILYINDK